MENASKALIIAGAILLAILLISLGIMIYNQAQSVTNGGQMSEAEVSTFNSKFSKYEGTNVKGSVVKSLINEMMAVNNNEDNQSAGIVINFDTSETGNITESSAVQNNKSYTVSIKGYDGTGRVNSISIKPNS